MLITAKTKTRKNVAKKTLNKEWKSSVHNIVGPISNVGSVKNFPQKNSHAHLYDYMENFADKALKKYIKDEELCRIHPDSVFITASVGPFFSFYLVKYTFHFTTIPEDEELRRLKTFHKINEKITYTIVEQLYKFDTSFRPLTRYISLQDFVDHEYRLTASDIKKLDVINLIEKCCFEGVPIISDAAFSEKVLANKPITFQNPWAVSKKFKDYVIDYFVNLPITGHEIWKYLGNRYSLSDCIREEDDFLSYVNKCAPYNLVSSARYEVNIICVKRINDLANGNPPSIAKVKQKIYHLIMKHCINDIQIVHEAYRYVTGRSKRYADIDDFNDLNVFNFTKKVCNR